MEGLPSLVPWWENRVAAAARASVTSAPRSFHVQAMSSVPAGHVGLSRAPRELPKTPSLRGLTRPEEHLNLAGDVYTCRAALALEHQEQSPHFNPERTVLRPGESAS